MSNCSHQLNHAFIYLNSFIFWVFWTLFNRNLEKTTPKWKASISFLTNNNTNLETDAGHCWDNCTGKGNQRLGKKQRFFRGHRKDTCICFLDLFWQFRPIKMAKIWSKVSVSAAWYTQKDGVKFLPNLPGSLFDAPCTVFADLDPTLTRRNWPFTDKVFRYCPISKA